MQNYRTPWRAEAVVLLKWGWTTLIIPAIIGYIVALGDAHKGIQGQPGTPFELSWNYLVTSLKIVPAAPWVLATWLIQMVPAAIWMMWRANNKIVSTFGNSFVLLEKQNRTSWEKLDVTMKQKAIVFNINMSAPYDKEHIADLRAKLATAFGNDNGKQTGKCAYTKSCKGQKNGHEADIVCTSANMCALDASTPHRWWSESMLGYLAVQAKWKAEDAPPYHKRRLSRVFVWTPADLVGPLGTKLIILHCLFGFDTYVILKKDYEALRNKLWEKDEFSALKKVENIENHFGLKEFVIWDGCGYYGGGEGGSSSGYRSFWNVLKADDPEREKDLDIDEQKAEGKKIKWRDFFDYEGGYYLTFFGLLIANHREVNSSVDFTNKASVWKAQGKDPVFKISTSDSEEIDDILDVIASLKTE